ncbi:MAG: DUF2956 domain-containing protein [Gammaproteobacteria bacterium]
MATKNKYQQPSPETVEQSLKIARATQRPGQTKEQTKLIAQGIQKGIELYKKQQKAKARELDKKLKKASVPLHGQQNENAEAESPSTRKEVVYKRAWQPWLLLVLTWSGIGLYFYFKG